MNTQNPAFRGAVDLSGLANKVVQEKLEQSGIKVENTNSLRVPAFSVEAEEGVIRQIIELSSAVPVVVCFYSPADASSLALVEKLDRLVLAGEGNWFLAKVNVVSQLKLAEAFGVLEPATVAMILAGEPKPLFQGDQDEDDLSVFMDKLVEVAKSQGITGQLTIGEAQPAEPKLSAVEQAALDAMDNGDFSAAVKIYEAEMQANPGNEQLSERLAQVRLVERTYKGDVEAELAIEPKDCVEAIRKADFFLAIGDTTSAFTLLLEWFDNSKPEERATISKHLLELFVVVGKNDPSVIAARKQLAAKMF